MHATVNGRPPHASSGPQAYLDELAKVPATLADLQELEVVYEALPCYCPDAPGRHLKDCHIEAIKRLAAQQVCTAGGGAFIGNGQAFDCVCTTCRMESAMAHVAERIFQGLRELAEATEEAGVRPPDLQHPMSIRGGEEEVAGDLDLKERYRRVVRALERNDHGQGEDGNWNCAHPEHEDEHPSMSILKDNRTGKITLHCHVCSPDSGTPERKEWTGECLKALGLPWSVLFPASKEGREPLW
jgi:hypothetical protein